MKQKYQIEVEEILQKVVEIEADSLDEAIDKAREQYRNEEIILYAECLMGTNFSEYKDEVLDKKKDKGRER